MNSEQLNDTLMLFSLLILADGKIFVEETDVMGRQLHQLQKSLETGIIFTPEMGVDWFKSNLFNLRNLMGSDNRQTYIKTTIVKLSKLPLRTKLKIYYAMIRIAHADAEYHGSERKMIELASDIWDLGNLDQMRDQAS